MLKYRLLSLLIIFACVSSAFAENKFNNEHGEFYRLLNSDYSDLKGGYYLQPWTDEDGGPGSFSLQKFQAQFEVPIPVNSDRYWRLGANYNPYMYDFKDIGSERVPSGITTFQKIEATGGMGWFISDDVLLTGAAIVGIYSNLENGLDERDVQVHGGGDIVFRFNAGSQLLLGVAADETFDDVPVYPRVGVRLLSSDGAWHLVLTVPTEIKLSYNTCPETELYIGGWISGDRFRYWGDRDSFDVQEREQRAGIGLVQWITGSLNVQLEFGAQINNQLEFKLRNTPEFEGDVETNMYLAAAFGYAF